MATIETPRIFALLVGINDYAAPIPRLNGCLNDIRNVEKYLRGHVTTGAQTAIGVHHTPSNLSITQEGPLHLCVLENEEATYSNIINGFREHLQKAGPDDVVWFHFSGHGMEDFTAREFKASLEPNGKDQNLVCYAKNPVLEHFLLADKELAILLHEVANDDTKAKAPHIIVSLDCCHSGSGTRNSEWELTEIIERTVNQQRFESWEEANTSGALRELSSYLDGHFKEDELALPLSEHILFSACTSIQTAADTPSGGIFTTSLLAALNTANGPLNYADLFMRTRATVQRARKEQLPQFETIGGFDPYRQFLNGQPYGTPDLFEFSKEGAHWMIKCGAIHGIPVRPKTPITVEIKAFGTAGETLGTGQLISVGAQKSKVTLAESLTLDEQALYQAKVTYLPLPALHVGLTGEASALEAIIAAWKPSLGIKWVKEATAVKDAELLVEATTEHYLIIDQRTQEQVFSLARAEDNAQVLVSSLGKIVSWERTLALANEKSRIRKRVSLEMEVQLDNHQKEQYTEEEIILDAASKDFFKKEKALFAGFLPKVVIKDTRQQLYGYLFHLRSDYSISAYEAGVVFRPDEHLDQKKVVLPLLKAPLGWGLGPDDKVACSYFKLFVTTEELDYQQLLQSGLRGDRATANWNWKPIGVSDDWCTLTMKIQLTASN